MIVFHGVELDYGRGQAIFKNMSFRLNQGQFAFVTGPSGSGKTSLVRLLSLAQTPTAGHIHFADHDITTLTRRQRTHLRRKIGVVFQDFRLLPHLSTFDNVALPLRIQGEDEIKVQHHVGELLEWVGLGQHCDALPATLSGGQQQRAAIARAVINRPRLLIADEPTGNLDAKIGDKLMHLFEELNKLGTTVIIATHDQHILERFSYPTLHIDERKITVKSPQTKAPKIITTATVTP